MMHLPVDTPKLIHLSIHDAVGKCRRVACWHPSRSQTEGSMEVTSKSAEALIAYAEGGPFDKKNRTILDEMIIDYTDGVLDREAARDLEASMRHFPAVARLVADKAEGIDLQNRLSMFYDGELDAAGSAEIERLIDREPKVAKLAADIRRGGDILQVALQPIPGQTSSRPEIEAIRRAFRDSSDDVDPVARFSILIAYAAGIPIEEESQAILENMIAGYAGGTLDRKAVRGLEASIRLSSSVAMLIADRTGEVWT